MTKLCWGGGIIVRLSNWWLEFNLTNIKLNTCTGLSLVLSLNHRYVVKAPIFCSLSFSERCLYTKQKLCISIFVRLRCILNWMARNYSPKFHATDGMQQPFFKT